MLRHLFNEVVKVCDGSCFCENYTHAERATICHCDCHQYSCECYLLEQLGNNEVGNKIYVCCCQDAVTEFIKHPEEYEVCIFIKS